MRARSSVLLYVHRNQKAHQDGEPRTATSTSTQLLNSDDTADDDELMLNVLRCQLTY